MEDILFLVSDITLNGSMFPKMSTTNSFFTLDFSGTSIIVSIGTLFFLIFSEKEKNIFKRKFSERLVVYLAVSDILYR